MASSIGIGQDHTPTGVVPGVQCAVHRISIDVDTSLSDGALRHQIFKTNMPENVFKIYPHGGISLETFLNQCRDMNVIPLVKLNFGRRIWDIQKRADLWKAKYSLQQWQRLSRLVAEIICNNYSFKEQYLPVFNEPYKWLDRHEVGMYTRATNHGIGSMRSKLPIVFGNDEWDLAIVKGNALHYGCVHFRQDFDYIGAQPLSSIKGEYSKIKAWADLANQYDKGIMATEAGSWWHNYTSATGHEVNKRIILECKKYDYKLCCIVLLDSNPSYFPRLGYRGWDWRYTRIESQPEIRPGLTYFAYFMNFIKQEGRKEDPMADQKDYQIPALIKEFAKEIGLDLKPNYNPYLPVLTSMFFQNDDHYHQPNQSISKADFDAFLERFLNFLMKKMGHSKALNLYYDEKGKWRPAAEREGITKSNPK